MSPGLAPPVIQPWERHAALGLLLRECTGRSDHGYVLVVQVRKRNELPGPGWHVYTSTHGKRHQSGGQTLELALERALQRLTSGAD
jgi:hypothetical protein